MRRWTLVAALAASTLFGAGPSHRKFTPPYEVLTTKNGVKVYYFTSPNVPLFEVHLAFEGGSDLDPKRKSGISMFAAAMIRRGVPGLDENAISRKLDDVAGGIDVSVSEEQVVISSFGLNEHAAVINKELFDEVSNPTFPEAPYRRIKANHLDSIRQLPDMPAGLASHVLDLVLFNGTPKARPGSGLKRDVQRLTLEDLRRYYPSLVRTDHLTALVVGGKGHEQVLDQVIRGIEAMPCARCGQEVKEPGRWDDPRWRLKPGRVMVIRRKGISESHVRMGFVGPRRNVPEFYDLRVAETILGGHFASRLNLIIREKMGLTYGIDASYSFGESVGTFVVSTSTRNEKLGELLVQVNKLLANFVAGEISEQDVRIAKDYLMGSFPLGLQNVYVIASSFFNGLSLGLAPDFLDVYQDQIQNVSVESVKAAVKKYFPLDRMQTVVVGDPKALTPVLEKKKISFEVREASDFL